MIQFTRLRLSGFKSFVDPTELAVEPGLTGVVGPNGCGKSNLVEALRWVMGESSAKQMRGGEMDDVIFSGNRSRPARNIAEVTLCIDNRLRTVPAPLNTADELEVSRRIERNVGSIYRVNGKEVRARDVQTLFADHSTGARSTAIVSQGRIGALIAASPADRCALLEEAAGISGLHARRHEAEIRLRAAENNLTRLDDVIQALSGQKQGLDRQVKQAQRYRTLTEAIRTLESALCRRAWDEALAAVGEARAALREAEAKVAETAAAAAKAQAAQARAYAAMDPLRTAQTGAAAQAQRLALAREALDAEERRLDRALADNAARLAQIDADAARAAEQCADAEARKAEIARERETLAAALATAPRAVAEAETDLTAAETDREAKEACLTTATRALAEAEADLAAARRTRTQAEGERERRRARLEQIERDLAQARPDPAAAERLDAARARLATAEAAAESAVAARDGAEAARADLATRAEAEDAAFAAADATARRLAAEIAALEAVLVGEAADAPLAARVRSAAGFEAAVAAILEHGADAPEDEAGTAPRGWRTLPPFAAPPAPPADGLQPLAPHVRAPRALARRLSLCFLVADAAEGDRLAPLLLPGQTLVSREGGLWRWDGYGVRAGAPSAALARLTQQNRLLALRGEAEPAREAQARAAKARETAQAEFRAADEACRKAREALKAVEAERTAARGEAERLERTSREAEDRLARLGAERQARAADLADAEAALAALGEADSGSGLPPLEARAARARDEAAEARRTALEARARLDQARRTQTAQTERAAALESEERAWEARRLSAADHRKALAQRRTEAGAERTGLAARPAALAEQRDALTAEIETAEAALKAAADALAVGDGALRAADAAAKEADALAARAREDRLRAEGQTERRDQACRDIAARARESLGCPPDDLPRDPAVADLSAEEIEDRLARRTTERDRLGPVNLRAEIEADDIGRQIEGMTAERADLLAAIARLRQGIAELNREGQGRLRESFEAVNRAFEETFTRLFGGGRASLNLIQGDDPLSAGLEIMASPPGKRLQTLTLLSGGEQALTALALMFAVFTSNPAPICILDEVDAPLDDANVDRFCKLLAETAKARSTRFLVITHHRMTMARMDRLYGVTMAERGVSQLVSVDLQNAENLREPATIS